MHGLWNQMYRPSWNYIIVHLNYSTQISQIYILFVTAHKLFLHSLTIEFYYNLLGWPEKNLVEKYISCLFFCFC